MNGIRISGNSRVERNPLEVTSNFTRESFRQAVRDCVEYIRAGDIFQVVPSQRLSVKTDVDPFEIYRSLRVVNPSPFMFYRSHARLRAGRMFARDHVPCRRSHCHRSARWRARDAAGNNEKEDKALEQELLADPKERAEHVMLVDLGRNDVGRVAQFGIDRIDRSDGRRTLQPRDAHQQRSARKAARRTRRVRRAKACLPAGTVSGAPKVRAMEIIDSIEPHRRGPYGGAVGYIDYRGNMDTCIALADDGRQRRHRVRASRLRCRCRQRPERGIRRNAQQGTRIDRRDRNDRPTR